VLKFKGHTGKATGMGLHEIAEETRSGIQRGYRERKKLQNKEAFLQKERNGRRKSYISQLLFSWNLSKPSGGKKAERSPCVSRKG